MNDYSETKNVFVEIMREEKHKSFGVMIVVYGCGKCTETVRIYFVQKSKKYFTSLFPMHASIYIQSVRLNTVCTKSGITGNKLYMMTWSTREIIFLQQTKQYRQILWARIKS